MFITPESKGLKVYQLPQDHKAPRGRAKIKTPGCSLPKSLWWLLLAAFPACFCSSLQTLVQTLPGSQWATFQIGSLTYRVFLSNGFSRHLKLLSSFLCTSIPCNLKYLSSLNSAVIISPTPRYPLIPARQCFASNQTMPSPQGELCFLPKMSSAVYLIVGKPTIKRNFSAARDGPQ